MTGSAKIGYVDLTTHVATTKEIPEQILRSYLGGRGLNAYLLYNHSNEGSEPLEPEAPIIFGAGLLSGYLSNSTSRMHVTGKSPETGIYGDSNMGGSIAAELKYAGFQHLVIKGRSDKPIYLWVHDGEIEFNDASKIWGLDTYQTQLRIFEELGDSEVKVACIGPAGERLVRFANIRHLMKKAAGRTGMGCLMGSKNLKAIAVRGHKGLTTSNPAQLFDLFQRQYNYIRRTKTFNITAILGNLFAWMNASEGERISVRNFQQAYFPEALGNLDIEIFMENYSEKKLACYSCPMHCQHRFYIKSGPFAGLSGEGPDWGPGWLLSANVGNVRLDITLAINELTNRYGLDVVTYLNYIGWLMELWQRKIIDEHDTGGLNFEWGNPDAIIQTLHQVVNREGIGGILSDGSDTAITRIGRGSEQYLHRCGKNLTEEGVNHRLLRASALGIHTSPRGNCHLRGLVNLEHMFLPDKVLEDIFGRHVNPEPNSWENKAWMATWMQYLCAVCDSIGLCKFMSKWFSPDFFGFEQMTEIINTVTDWNMTAEELMNTGERIWNIERLFNIREGLGRKHDMPPPIFFAPINEGATKGICLDRKEYEKALDEYYELHGWDREGRPLTRTLERLCLDEEPSHKL
jgi:aldehyde:ferredoxin oxidoreductase